MSLKPLTPPLRFSTVAFACTDEPQPWQVNASSGSTDPREHPHHRESVYRGAYPKPRNLYFLSRLHLRTVLSLTPRPLDNDDALLAWSTSSDQPPSFSSSLANEVGKAGIQLLHVRCEKPKDESGGLTREGAARALSILLDRRNHPIYVHCLDGVDVTSTLVACMRKVQAWSNPAILSELGRALRDSNSSEWVEVPAHLSSFLNKFGQPDGIRLPPRNRIPSWLWPSPNPLSVLADPYAWAATSNSIVPGHEQNGSASGSSPNTALHPHSRRDRHLPIHHPTLKLHFDVDPDLPLEPVGGPSSAPSTAAAASQRPMTPSRPLQAHSRTSSYNSISNLRTPPQSRPASRAGRPSAGYSHLSGRSASLAPEDDRAAPGSARRSDGTMSDLPPPNGPDLDSMAVSSAVPGIAAFLEDQLQNDEAPPLLPHGVHDSPTRRPRSNLTRELHLPVLSAADCELPSPAQVARTTASTMADDDDIDVSTPRARPTTSSIGITGTIFHRDDEITDHEGEPVSGRNVGRSMLDQRRRFVDGADGEQTPTKTQPLLSAITSAPRLLPGDRAPSDASWQPKTGIDQGGSGASRVASEVPENVVQSPTAYRPHESSSVESNPQKDASEDNPDEDQASSPDTDAEEEEDEEEEDDYEEEEDDDEEDEQDDLALEALDLEGY